VAFATVEIASTGANEGQRGFPLSSGRTVGVRANENHAGVREPVVTRRLPHGGTTRPTLSRPGNGYGRSVRSGPVAAWRTAEVVMHARRRGPFEILLSVYETEDVTQPA